MTYNNRYNILDKIIAKFRLREITKNFNLEGKKILDFGCGPSLNVLKNRYSTCSKVTLVDKLGEPFKNGNTEFLNYNNNPNDFDKKITLQIVYNDRSQTTPTWKRRKPTFSFLSAPLQGDFPIK